jgi:hypothetical protein
VVDIAREQELAAQRLMEVVFGHRRADERARHYASHTVGELLERLDRAERERDAAVAALHKANRRVSRHAVPSMTG